MPQEQEPAGLSVVVSRSENSEVLDDYEQLESAFLKYAQPMIARQREAVRKVLADQKEQQPAMKEQEEQEFYCIMPPIESFMAVGAEDRAKAFFACVQPGDLLICKIDKKIDQGLICLVIATDAGVRRDLTDTGAAVFCNYLNVVQNSYTSDQSRSRGSEFEIGDLVSVVVIRVLRDKFKVLTSMKQESLPDHKKGYKLGHIDPNDPDSLPVHYVRQHEAAIESMSYDSLLHATPSFHNPASSQYLTRHLLKLHPADDTLTLFQNRMFRSYEEKDCAPHLRKLQSKKWAAKPLAEVSIRPEAGVYLLTFVFFLFTGSSGLKRRTHHGIRTVADKGHQH